MKLVIDTNLLVLLVVGRTDRGLIQSHKRTKTFQVEDFDLLVRFIGQFQLTLVTPHIVTETSNLIVQTFDKMVPLLRATLAALVQSQDEQYTASVELTDQPAYPRLGLTDAAILQLVNDGAMLITTDMDLYLEAARMRPELAMNFNHLRMGGLLS